MLFIIQKNLLARADFQRLADAVDRYRLKHLYVDVIPFSSEISPEITVDEPCVILGATTLCRIARERGWKPGSFLNDNFDARIWIPAYGPHALNSDAVFSAFGDVQLPASTFFIRPCLDSKTFAGEILEPAEFITWREGVLKSGATIDASTPVMTAEPTKIDQEIRLFVVEGKIVTGSIYKMGGRLMNVPMPIDQDALDFGADMVKLFKPARAFVLDICRTPMGFRVVEVNNINSAGYYQSDISLILQALDGLSVD